MGVDLLLLPHLRLQCPRCFACRHGLGGLPQLEWIVFVAEQLLDGVADQGVISVRAKVLEAKVLPKVALAVGVEATTTTPVHLHAFVFLRLLNVPPNVHESVRHVWTIWTFELNEDDG